MFYLNDNKSLQTPWTRGVLAVLVVFSLSLALQPCAMAMSGDQGRDCPHCPPPESQDHHQHHGSETDEIDQAPCASASDDCSLDDEFNYDGRNAQVKLKDLPIDAPLAINDLIDAATVARFDDLRGVFPTRSPPPDSAPPLNVLYCVYLD